MIGEKASDLIRGLGAPARHEAGAGETAARQAAHVAHRVMPAA